MISVRGSHTDPRQRRSAWLAAVALLAVIGLGQQPAGATHLTEAGDPSGPSVPWGFNEDWGWSEGGWSAALSAGQAAFVGAITPESNVSRFHVQWARVEGQQGVYDWTVSDGDYEALRAAGVRPLMMVYNAPEWARDPTATCPVAAPCAYPPAPEHDGAWRDFVEAAVERYPDLLALEVWNEPNIGRFWAPAPSPERYAAVLEAAHEGLVAARGAVPVLSGGLLPTRNGATSVSAADFLGQLYTLGAAAYFEGIAAHPYPRQTPLVEAMWRRITALTEVRDQNADADTPIWITEVGVSTNAADDAGVSPEQQGDELIRLYHSIEGHGIRSFVIHRLHDLGSGDADEGSFFNETGVLTSDLRPKPAYCELGAAIGQSCPETTAPAPEPAPQAQLQPKADLTLTLATAKPKVKKGRSVLLSGRIDAAGDEGVCEAARTVELQQRRPEGTTFVTFAQVQSDALGGFSHKLKVKKTLELRARVVETAACTAAQSNTETVKVKKRR